MSANHFLPLAGTIEGEQRKADALATLERYRNIYVNRARRAFVARLLDAGTATADDVREAVELPPGLNPNLFGAVPSLFARLRIVTFAGFDVSRRSARHAGLNRRWELIDAPAAQKWLADHPDLPDPPDDDQDGAQGLLFPVHPNDATPTASTAGAAVATL